MPRRAGGGSAGPAQASRRRRGERRCLAARHPRADAGDRLVAAADGAVPDADPPSDQLRTLRPASR